MSALAERLRQEAEDWVCGPVVSEAADEIDRLKALNAELVEALERLCCDARITGLDQKAGWDCWFIQANAVLAKAHELGGE